MCGLDFVLVLSNPSTFVPKTRASERLVPSGLRNRTRGVPEWHLITLSPIALLSTPTSHFLKVSKSPLAHRRGPSMDVSVAKHFRKGFDKPGGVQCAECRVQRDRVGVIRHSFFRYRAIHIGFCGNICVIGIAGRRFQELERYLKKKRGKGGWAGPFKQGLFCGRSIRRDYTGKNVFVYFYYFTVYSVQ